MPTRHNARNNSDFNAYGEREFGENIETENWLREASCDFSELVFRASGLKKQESEEENIKKQKILAAFAIQLTSFGNLMGLYFHLIVTLGCRPFWSL